MCCILFSLLIPGSNNTNNSNGTARTSTATNNSSSSTNNGSPLSTEQQLYPSNNQSSVGGGHSDLVNGDERHPTPENNYSPPLKSMPSSAVDMLAATHPHHPGHSIFESYNMTNGHNQNINQNPVAKKGKCCQTFSLWNIFPKQLLLTSLRGIHTLQLSGTWSHYLRLNSWKLQIFWKYLDLYFTFGSRTQSFLPEEISNQTSRFEAKELYESWSWNNWFTKRMALDCFTTNFIRH